MKRLILFGGAFDPIHLGHINMALNASKDLDSDVLFIPARISVWKNVSLDREDKMKIVELAIKDYPRFHISDYELKSDSEKNYSINTVRHFKEVYPDYELYFLIGTDNVNTFHKWEEALEISKLVKIIYFNRPGFKLFEENVHKYHMVKIPGKELEIASSSIQNLNSLELPWEVIKYIEEHNLYFMPKVKSFFDNEKRFQHCLSVACLAYEIADATKAVEPYKAYLAGILHDSGKATRGEEAFKIMNSVAQEYISLDPCLYHQFIGAEIAKNEFGIKDESVLNAIRYHATGNDNMDALAKIVYASDKTDPLRGYDSSEYIKAMKQDVDAGFKVVLEANKEYLSEKNKSFDNELTYKCMKKYLD